MFGLGLPQEAVGALIVCFLRKNVVVGMLKSTGIIIVSSFVVEGLLNPILPG